MRNFIISVCVGSACVVAHAGDKPKIMDDGIDMQNTPVYNLGFVDASTVSNDFTEAEIAQYAISAGQLCGVNPQTGEMITNSINLLPIMVRSAHVAGGVNAGYFLGDGSGLHNLSAPALKGFLPLSSMPTSGVWNVEG